jgi:hypothetical protein
MHWHSSSSSSKTKKKRKQVKANWRIIIINNDIYFTYTFYLDFITLSTSQIRSSGVGGKPKDSYSCSNSPFTHMVYQVERKLKIFFKITVIAGSCDLFHFFFTLAPFSILLKKKTKFIRNRLQIPPYFTFNK